jgi:large subunit ribosomal protein L14e
LIKPPIELGRVVLSRAGRDIDRYFVVVGQADEQHVLIADGRLRKFDSPKKKKLKHLSAKPACMSEIQTKLEKGEQVQDAQIRKFLALSGYVPQDKQEE